MNELIKINNENKVDGRSLHEFLQIETPFKKWIDRMLEYGFVEGVDFWTKMSETLPQGGRPATEYDLTIDMAKEISMIQRNERGKQARLYFIECEKRLKGKPMTQLDILQQSIQVLQEQERRMAHIELDMAEVKDNQRIQTERLNNLNGVNIEGSKRQRLSAVVKAYALKAGLTFNKAWHEFKAAYNTAFNTNVALSMRYYCEQNNLKKITMPEFFERKNLLDDALRIADKLVNQIPAK